MYWVDADIKSENPVDKTSSRGTWLLQAAPDEHKNYLYMYVQMKQKWNTVKNRMIIKGGNSFFKDGYI